MVRFLTYIRKGAGSNLDLSDFQIIFIGVSVVLLQANLE